MNQRYHHGDLRAALLDAAAAILERDGIGGLTLRAAAREAGVSHAAPTHHFGDLTGLLSELAASGFVRLRACLVAEVADAAVGEREAALGRGYVGFALGDPGLFQLMFRSERLDWSRPALSDAGAASFSVLMEGAGPDGAPSLVAALTRWSLAHGLATLLIDGRFAGVAQRMLPGVDIEGLVEGVLRAG